jgi:Tol biopolymer transport system component
VHRPQSRSSSAAWPAPRSPNASASGPEGARAIFDSHLPSISADGRYVAFWSGASNLVAGDANGTYDVFAHDRLTGTTELVSVATGGAQGDIRSGWEGISISADGRFVAFESRASTLVAGDTNGVSDVFVRDRLLGTTERVSVSTGGAEGNQRSTRPSISPDGHYVAFESLASNLVAGDANGFTDIFVRDRLSGTTEIVSVATGGQPGDRESQDASISADGRFVAFMSLASNFVAGDVPVSADVFVRDRQNSTTDLVSGPTGAPQPATDSEHPAISGDGRYVAFVCHAALVADDTNNSYDVYVRDRQNATTERVSVSNTGAQGNFGGEQPSISADGRLVAFASDSWFFVDGDTNNFGDVFVRDRLNGTTDRVSVGNGGTQGNNASEEPAISADGRYVAFWSNCSNLVAGTRTETRTSSFTTGTRTGSRAPASRGSGA